MIIYVGRNKVYEDLGKGYVDVEVEKYLTYHVKKDTNKPNTIDFRINKNLFDTVTVNIINKSGRKIYVIDKNEVGYVIKTSKGLVVFRGEVMEKSIKDYKG